LRRQQRLRNSALTLGLEHFAVGVLGQRRDELMALRPLEAGESKNTYSKPKAFLLSEFSAQPGAPCGSPARPALKA
jgi:hypothetical protein